MKTFLILGFFAAVVGSDIWCLLFWVVSLNMQQGEGVYYIMFPQK